VRLLTAKTGVMEITFGFALGQSSPSCWCHSRGRTIRCNGVRYPQYDEGSFETSALDAGLSDFSHAAYIILIRITVVFHH